MASVLLQVLERTEINKLPKGVQNKLEKIVAELQNANESLKAQHERFKADTEQQHFDTEKRLVESQELTVSASKVLQTLREENKTLCEELNTIKGIDGETSEEKTQQQTKTRYEIEVEKRELARLLEKRTQEVENLNEDLNRLKEKLTETTQVKMELQFKLDDIQSSEASVQYREKRLEQEKELLEKKNEWLTAELKTKTEEVLNISREKGKEILGLQGSLKDSEDQVSSLKIQLTSLKEINENQSKRAEDLNNKLKQVKEEQSTMEAKYCSELNAHTKLSSLYKGAATDMEAKNQELSRAVEELSKVVKDIGEANKVLEKKMSESEELRTRLEAEFQEKIKTMERELENAAVKAAGKNCCLRPLTEEQLDSMCPTAAAIAAIVNPGMKFFDLYNAYMECQTQLQLEKQETKRVSQVLDEIVKEVESKAPVLKRQREEFENMQSSMASLWSKLEQARTEIYILQKEKEEAKHCYERMEKDKLKIESQLEDTSTQLCSLLLELEEARGNHVAKDNDNSATISSTSGVVSPCQVSFRSVMELQSQNQSLLARLRELEEEKDQQQNQVTTARVSEFEANLDKLQTELERLREERNQQKQLADSSARQRDMYKALLSQSTGFSLPHQGLESSSQPVQKPSMPATRFAPQRTAVAESAQMAEAKAAFKQLSEAFSLYKKEKTENDRMLNETNDKLQKQLAELHSNHAKLSSQLEFSNKRYEMLQESLSAYRREITSLQDRNQKMAATTQRYEHSIHTMSQDLRQANEKLALEQVRNENLTKEKEMLRQAESQLSREKEAMLAEQRNQNLLLTNLKTIQLTMEQTETETRQRLNNKIEHLEAEMASLKCRMEEEVAQRHSLGQVMDAQLLEAKKQLETQNTLHQRTKELLRVSEQQVTALKAQLAAASSCDTAATTLPTRAAGLRVPLRVRSPVPAASQQPSHLEQELVDVKGLLYTAEQHKSELADQLKMANSSVEHYRVVVLTLEESLKKEKESRSPLEIRLKESEDLQKQLEKKILEVEKIKEAEQEQRRNAINDLEKQVCDLQRSLKTSQAEQQNALEKAAAAITRELKAIQDNLLQTKVAAEAQAKYERELMLHAADVEALQELKKRAQQEAAQRMELEEQVNKTTLLLQEKIATWNMLEQQLREDLSSKSQWCTEIEKQNALLHQQMDEMASKSHQVQQQPQLDLSFTEEEKTTEQILEILRFVRREKEIAVAQCEALKEEALRHRQRVEHQNREIKELHETLNSERMKIQVTSRTLLLQEEQLKKMESMSALEETNRLLKMDRDKLEQELQQAQARVTKLQSDITPLHQSLSVLSEKNCFLQADKRLLEEDLKQWKVKTQELISQQKDSHIEERQKIVSEREAQQRRIAQLVEDTAKLKTELARSSASSNSAQNQLQCLKDSMTRLTSERDTLKKDLETKTSDILEKNKTITQVKKIGRRYKSQYEELKSQHDKLVKEMAAKAASDMGLSQEQELKQELTKVGEELIKAREELKTLKEEVRRKQEEAQKSQQELEDSQKENKQIKEKFQEVQGQLIQNQNQLTEVQSQLSLSQNQLQQNQNQLTQCQKELQQSKASSQQAQNQLKSIHSQAQSSETQIQQLQTELKQAKEALQQSHSQEVNNLKSAVSQADIKVAELQGELGSLQKIIDDRERDIKCLQEQLRDAQQAVEASQTTQANQNQSSQSAKTGDASQAQEELAKLRQELSDGKNREQQLRHQIAEKEEKTKKVFMGAKTKISQLNTAREQLSQEVEELKQTKKELEVRMNALQSQYEGRLLRLERELRDLRGTPLHCEPREEPQDQGGAKVSDQARPSDQRKISLKSPAQDRGSSSLSEPPTANIRPTPSTPSPSNKPSSSPGNKATPRASIRPMVTPTAVPIPTPTATVMPTTQTDNQEVMMNSGASAHSTSSTQLPALTPPASSQATVFVQPTQQQAASHDMGLSMEMERPSTSSSFTGTAGSKRGRGEEDEENRPESSHTSPTTKKLKLKPSMALQMEGEDTEENLREKVEQQDAPDDTQEFPEEGFSVLHEEEEDIEQESASQSVPSDHLSSQSSSIIQDVIVIETETDSCESKDGEERQEDRSEQAEEEKKEMEEKQDVYEDEDNTDDNSTVGGEYSNKESGEVAEQGGDDQFSETPHTAENICLTSDSPHPSESSHGGEGSSSVAGSNPSRDLVLLNPTPSTSSLSSPTPRPPHPRRAPHPLPPRLYIQPAAPELGPLHTQRQTLQLRRPSVGRGPQLTPGIGSMQHFFDDDDRMVPSTPTLVVPHRTDGFAEAIHSPQVAGLSTRFRFGPPEDLLSQTSSSHSDLGQLASQGGLGMYDSPLFLAAHDEDGGGRSVPTTPLQVAAPVTVFTEALPSDSGDNIASQSVPMVTASTGLSSAVDDGDEVFMEQEGEGPGVEPSVANQRDLEPVAPSGQQSEDASLPSTSQDLDSSSVPQRHAVSSHPLVSSMSGRGARGGRAEARTLLSRRGTYGRGGRGGATGRGGVASL